jgi:hypothetical protein
MTGHDKRGCLWAYAYTNRAEIAKAFPQGCACAETTFRSLFSIVEKDPNFTGGIIINSASDMPFPLMRELFGLASEALNATDPK